MSIPEQEKGTSNRTIKSNRGCGGDVVGLLDEPAVGDAAAAGVGH